MRVLVISGSRARLPDPVYPLGAAIIATAVRDGGHQISCFDALRHTEPITALSEEMDSFRPQVVLFSIRNIDSGAFPSPDLYFEDHLPLVECCRETLDVPIVVGGSGFSLMPKAFMALLKPNYGVVGEGASQITNILSQIERGNECSGIWELSAEQYPFYECDRALFDADWYYEYGGVANIQSKQGCPKKCIYCTYPFLEGYKSKEASPQSVVDEMESIAGKGITHFFFVDSVFNGPEEHAAAVCEEILKRNMDVSFTGYFIPSGELREFPQLLKRAGCSAVEFGTDALSDSMLDSYNKGFGVKDALGYAEKIAGQGIPQCHNLILGGPGETQETMEESIRRMDEINPAAVIVTIGLRVYPGTPLERMASELDNSVTVADDKLDPVFYVEPGVMDTIIDKVSGWVDERPGWICPGLKKRYNARYLARRRMHLKQKGVLWPLL
jgi:radical SAM superfamily enzyme YgiQ (UPF0313 family)